MLVGAFEIEAWLGGEWKEGDVKRPLRKEPIRAVSRWLPAFPLAVVIAQTIDDDGGDGQNGPRRCLGLGSG